MGTAAHLLAAGRPRQWVKNLLVVAAPLAAGTLAQRDVLVAVALAFATFSLTASGVYLVNDVRDVEADRAHPTKRNRPIAAGHLGPGTAAVAGAVLLAAGPAVALVAGSEDLALVLAVYAAIQLTYCFWLKHQPVVDLVVISSGFLLRAVAGGAAASVALSQWFLLVTAFGSLFMAAGKRYSEKKLVAGDHSGTRRSLELYSESYLRFVWSLAASITVLAYCLWAFELRADDGTILPAVSIAPFVIGLLRYAVDVDLGEAGAPEDIVLGDRVLQACGVAWLLVFTAGVVLR